MKLRRIISIILFLLAPIVLMGAAVSRPVINTTHTATGTTITMNLPQNYSGFVQTYFDGTNWQTYATSSPLTATQTAQIQSKLLAQQQYWNNFWQAQQKMFQAQQQLFNNLWTSFGF